MAEIEHIAISEPRQLRQAAMQGWLIGMADLVM